MAGPTVRKLRKLARLRGGKQTVDELVSEMAGNAPAAEEKPAAPAAEKAPEAAPKAAAEPAAPKVAPKAAPKAEPAVAPKKETKAKK
jgi:uncharacterized membrane protein